MTVFIERELFALYREDWVKRGFDILFSASVLVLLFPVYFVIALAIKCSSKGPVFYSSLRAGLDGRIIKCYKFRTMCIDAEVKLKKILEDPTYLREWKRYSKLKKDPRVTKVGKWLRKTSLDEMPQFWNVLKGDLSVVGPRPYLIEEVMYHLGLRKEKILSVRPGITGLWQTSGRNLLTFEERISLEATYIDLRCFSLDLFLVCKTIPLIIRAKGAY